jgi:hypothetical protein
MVAIVPLNDIARALGTLSNQVSVSGADLVEIRHKLTANINHNLYGDGDREEGRAALTTRATLDEFLYNVKPLDPPQWQNVTESTRRAIILSTFVELLGILERAREAGHGTRKGIKREMKKLLHDPDRVDRFHDRDKIMIRQIADGFAILAKRRFDRLHENLRVRGGEFMKPRQ